MDKTDLRNRRFSVLSGFGLYFRFAPFSSLMAVILFIVFTCAPLVLIQANALFINKTILFLQNPSEKRVVFISLVFIAGLMVIQELASALYHFFLQCARIFQTEGLTDAIVRKKALLRYNYIEERESLDLISRVSEKACDQAYDAFFQGLQLSRIILLTLGVIVTVAVSAWWAALALLIFFIPFYIFAHKSGRENYEVDKNSAHLSGKKQISIPSSARANTKTRVFYFPIRPISPSYGRQSAKKSSQSGCRCTKNGR